jgi:SAM-dependent methyltransferase
MNTYKQTKLSYEINVYQHVKHWDPTGVRERHIKLAFKLAKTDKPIILELGCGPGRDAAFMVRKAKEYTGIDYSSKLIDIAKDNVPGGKFILGDIVTTAFPNQCDVIIAFASLIHLDEAKIKRVFEKAAKALRSGGIFYISTKDGKGVVTKQDNFGTRTYYLYKISDLQKFAGEHFEIVYMDIEHVRDQDWVEAAFKRLP